VLYLFQVGFVLRATRGKAAGGNPDGERRCDGDPVPPRDGTENIDEATGGAAGVLPVIVVFAVAFRVLLLFSEPIQEVDAYQYLWDGQAAAAGINPFRFSPQQVLDASAGEASSEQSFDPNYTWFQGRLEFNEADGAWHLTYDDSPEPQDQLGGDITLSSDVQLDAQHNGTLVRVTGEFNAAKLDRLQKPIFQVTRIDPL